METNRLYSLPEVYDIAFDDRDFAGEADFLLAAAARAIGRQVETTLELACGPGRHMRELAKRGIVSDGLDNSPEMIAYAEAKVDQEQLRCLLLNQDMVQFDTARTYDCIFVMLCGFAQLKTNRQILCHLQSVANSLTDDGVYIINHPHPRDFFLPETSFPAADRIWRADRNGIEVTTDWGGENQWYDPISELDHLTISLTVRSDGKEEKYSFCEQYRRCSYQALRALIALNGRLEVADEYGDYDLNVPFDNSEMSVRLVTVLKKR